MSLPESGKKDFILVQEIRDWTTPKLEKTCFETTKEQCSASVAAVKTEVLEFFEAAFEATEEPTTYELAVESTPHY